MSQATEREKKREWQTENKRRPPALEPAPALLMAPWTV